MLEGGTTIYESLVVRGTTYTVSDKKISIVNVGVMDLYHTHKKSKLRSQEGFN